MRTLIARTPCVDTDVDLFESFFEVFKLCARDVLPEFSRPKMATRKVSFSLEAFEQQAQPMHSHWRMILCLAFFKWQHHRAIRIRLLGKRRKRTRGNRVEKRALAA